MIPSLMPLRIISADSNVTESISKPADVCWCSVEDELYRSVISSHEEKHQQLIVENHELREILTYLLTEISALTVNCTHCKGSSRHNDQV